MRTPSGRCCASSVLWRPPSLRPTTTPLSSMQPQHPLSQVCIARKSSKEDASTCSCRDCGPMAVLVDPMRSELLQMHYSTATLSAEQVPVVTGGAFLGQLGCRADVIVGLGLI